MDVKAHLHDRGLDPSRYNCSWDDETASFVLFNLSGQLVGYQQYRPFAPKSVRNNPKDGRYFTYAKDKLAVWGLESFDYRDDVLFVVEGVFDACKLHNLGVPAVAVLTNNPSQLKPWLGCLPRLTVAVCDNDKAGLKLAETCSKHVVCDFGKDLGDMSNCQVRNFLKEALPDLRLTK